MHCQRGEHQCLFEIKSNCFVNLNMLYWETENYHVMLSFWAVSLAGDCFVVYTFVRKQSPDETNGWQQSHQMIDLAFRLRPVRLLRVWVSESLTQADS